MPVTIGYIRAGKLRALAVTSATRSDALPDIPTVAEFVPDTRRTFGTGSVHPRARQPAVISKLNSEINAVLADPKMKERFAEIGGTAVGGTPADFGKLIADEIEKWGKVIRAANIKLQ